VTDYVIQNQEWPATLTDLGYESASINNIAMRYEINVYKAGVVAAEVGITGTGDPMYITLEPHLKWCSSNQYFLLLATESVLPVVHSP